MLPLVTTMPLSTTAFSTLAVGGSQCGTKLCDVYQFCSSYHQECEDCAMTCDETHHNFDQEVCMAECREYLHDRNFVKLSDYAAEIQNLKIYLSVTFILTLLLLILFFAVNGTKIFRCFRHAFNSIKKKGKKQIPIEPVTMANPNTESPKMRRHQNNHQININRTSSIFTVTGTEYDQKTVSTPISRHPAEDTLTSSVVNTDYSYDNKALQLTPVGEEKPKIETTF
ncbi:CLUMA_CG007929, isoform A [Clunio marinus]|uniref:CLUMA_CG007929, isoform A n=1 Tax=Clunio marinus TaxID=568069 RepID=A0A1J1I659_9DIPT|nr:CLUMA_CG007929, isoform A [Clunio marinus]